MTFKTAKTPRSGNTPETLLDQVLVTPAHVSILASIRWVPSEFNVSDGLTREDLMPTCRKVLEKYAKEAGFELSESIADNSAWTKCLDASHIACLNNGAKRPETKKRPRKDEEACEPNKKPKREANPKKNGGKWRWNDWQGASSTWW